MEKVILVESFIWTKYKELNLKFGETNLDIRFIDTRRIFFKPRKINFIQIIILNCSVLKVIYTEICYECINMNFNKI